MALLSFTWPAVQVTRQVEPTWAGVEYILIWREFILTWREKGYFDILVGKFQKFHKTKIVVEWCHHD